MNRLPIGVVAIVGLSLLRTAGGQAFASPVDRIVPNIEALSRQPMTALPPPPPWLPGTAGQWTIGQIDAEFKKATGKQVPINYVRSAYVLPDYAWLLRFQGWFKSLGKPLNIRYQDELFDCDKYSRCFVAFADLLARRGGEVRGSICVAWATVFNDHRFAGAEAGGAHAIVIVGTSQGLFVIEPQTASIIPLAKYPNRDTLVAIYF
jgi:hypothetical protein